MKDAEIEGLQRRFKETMQKSEELEKAKKNASNEREEDKDDEDEKEIEDQKTFPAELRRIISKENYGKCSKSNYIQTATATSNATAI